YAQDVQTANAELSLIQAKNNFEKAKINLLKYLTLDIAEEYILEAPSENQFLFENISTNPIRLYDVALQNRQDFQSQKLKLENAQHQITIANAGLYPSLNGNYRFSTSAVEPGKLFNRNVYSMGLSLSFPIFSNWNTEYVMQSAEVQLKNSTEDMIVLEKEIKVQVKNTLLDLQSSKAQTEVTGKALLSSKRNWNLKSENYELGAATFIELQQSYRDYLQAQYNDVQAQYSYFTKQFEMLNVLGKLNTSQ
ncbi:MAG: TolC family protein, partial [Ignavibacteria bacterium]|nr:TolC family protein [Ignavibacteria bacterium]